MVFDISLVFWPNLVPWIDSITKMVLWNTSQCVATQSLFPQAEVTGRRFFPGENKSRPRLLRGLFSEVSSVD